jgi:hypothetical protein
MWVRPLFDRSVSETVSGEVSKHGVKESGRVAV